MRQSIPAAHQPTPDYRAWADSMIGRLVPLAADLRRNPAHGSQNRARALESIVAELRAVLAGNRPAPRGPAVTPPQLPQLDLFA